MREQNGPMKEQHSSISESQNRRPFGNYDLVRRIDVGGMGEVYLARQRSAFGREVAMKIIRSDLMHDTTARKRFLREAEVSAHLKHEHILPLFEFGEEQGRLFLVTPYIKGGTLGHRLQSGPLSLSETHQLFSALVQAVAYIHKRGVIHRDLKPSNILLDRDDETAQVYVRLIDFGIASLPGIVEDAQLTTAGHEMGTIAYMAPERLDGIAAPGNDIYSLGIILYQMLIGQLPDNNATVGLPQPLDAVMKRCIASNPANRYANADELLRAFEYAYRTVRATPSRPQLPATPVVAQPATPAPTPVLHPSAYLLDLDNLPDPDDLDEDEPTPRRITAPPPALSRLSLPQKNTAQENRASSRSELILTPLSSAGNIFSRADYNAPTTSIGPMSLAGQQQVQHVTSTATLGMKPQLQPSQKGKRSALALIPISIIVILLVIAGTIFKALPALATAKITISPQVHSISNTFTLNGDASLQSVDAGTTSIPVSTLNFTENISKTGPTSGEALPFGGTLLPCIGLGNCVKVVSTDDINQLAQQISQEPQVLQDMKARLQAKNATQVGQPDINPVSANVNPPVDTRSDTVTVSLTEKVSVQYILNKDAQDLAHVQLLQQMRRQLGSNYQLLDQMTRFSQPQVQNGDGTNTIRIVIAAAGLAEYHIPDSQLITIASLIKGKNVLNARAILVKQPGIDAKLLSISISYGNTLPGDAKQMTINIVNPPTLPSVQLPS